MTTHSTAFTVHITRAEANPAGRLAEAELAFIAGACEGCRLGGFTVWENKRGAGEHVTFPGRAYTNTKGEKRTFSFMQGSREALAAVRTLILDAYHQASAAARAG